MNLPDKPSARAIKIAGLIWKQKDTSVFTIARIIDAEAIQEMQGAVIRPADQKFVDDIASACHVIATKLNFSDEAFRAIGAYVAAQFDVELDALRLALLEIIKTCEDYQNTDCESVDIEQQATDGQG